MKKLFTFVIALMAAISINADDALYLVGDGTPIGWEGDVNQRQSTRMRETSPGVYVWTGFLKHGNEGFKIQEGTSSWDVRYCPSSENFAISQAGGTDTYQSSNDWKWNPSDEEWKWYTITVDKNNGTLSWQAATPTLLVADGEGYFNIGTPEELNTLAFMCRNNINKENYKVRLTADIDYTAYKNGSLDAIGITEKYAPFRGEFDGQNHTVTVDFESYSTRFGFFGTIEENSTVHNLKVAGKITATNKNQTGGICGLLKGGSKIYNCISAAEIVDNQSGDGTIAGISAVTYGSCTIENCAFFGKISAPNRDGNGGILSWSNNDSETTIKNCLVVADINWGGGADFGRNNPTVVNTYKTTTSDETLGNGQMTYKLNNHVSGAEDWFQTLGTDLMPSPLSSSAKLYANGTFYCDGVTSKGGDVVLSNTNESVVDPHVFGTNGVCTGCHAVGQEAELVDGKYQINNEGNLLWWGAYVNAGHTDVNAALNADLDMTGTVYTPIGTPDHTYVGSFYGQNHSVTFALDNTPYNYQGLFGVVTDGVWIERVIVKGFIKGHNYVGGIVGGTNGGSNNTKQTNIWHCGNEATITAADANAAGIIGVNMSGSASIILTNCYNKGDITSGKEAGALSGWLGGGWSSVRNCYNSGTVKNGGNVSKAFGRNNGCYFTNCYYTATSGTDNSTENTQNGTPAQVADAALASGELAYKLCQNGDGSFSQLIGTDAYPAFGDTPVSYVGDAGYATMYDTTTGYTLNGDIKAYAAVLKGEWITLTEVENVPESTPVVLKGTYYNKVAADLPAINVANSLVGTDADVTADGTMYILADGPDGVGFYKASGDIPAGKAYIVSSSSVKAFFFEADDATGINEVNGQWSMINGQSIYNIAGQRVSKMQKGINIVNGKKILF